MTILSPFSDKKISEGISDSLFNVLKSRIRYYGLREFIKYSSLYVFYRIKSLFNLFFIKKRPRFYSLKNMARAYGIEIVNCPEDDVHNEGYLKNLKERNIDAIICLIPQIVRESFLKLARVGCLNTHCSMLPKHKGREPLFWALLNQEKDIGITIHIMDKGIDTGPILKQTLVEVGNSDTLHNLYCKTSEAGSKLMIDVINDIQNNNLKYVNIEGKGSSYNPWPVPKDVALFRKLGRKFI